MVTLLILQIFITLIAFMLGGSIASFLGVVIERAGRKEPITGRSHCACGRKLEWYENIPVFGWLRVGGKTKCCNTKLPVWYLLFEIGLGLVFAAGAWFGLALLG
jgi:prepilin signal peptidase PulO-like enzyme (type II secretory pathway)